MHLSQVDIFSSIAHDQSPRKNYQKVTQSVGRVQEAPAKVRKQGKSVAGIPVEAGSSKHSSTKGRAMFEDLTNNGIIQEPCFRPEMIVCLKQW